MEFLAIPTTMILRATMKYPNTGVWSQNGQCVVFILSSVFRLQHSPIKNVLTIYSPYIKKLH
jgi:hypothetical protein